MFTSRVPDTQTASVYASMDEGARVLFEIEGGVDGELVGSTTYRKGEREHTYWQVVLPEGTGWIWEKFVDDVRWVGPGDERPALPGAASPPVATGSPRGQSVGETEPDVPSSSEPTPARPLPDIATINHASPGSRVDVEAAVVRGQYTVVDFYSQYCGPCRAVAPMLEDLAKAHPRVVLRKVDINRPGVRGIDWSSPVVQQYRIPSVPYLRIYDPAGTLAAEGNAAWAYLNMLSSR
jgi:thiol-disulfide isomerase/thioredoxin